MTVDSGSLPVRDRRVDGRKDGQTELLCQYIELYTGVALYIYIAVQ